jgi:hypothetical protein
VEPEESAEEEEGWDRAGHRLTSFQTKNENIKALTPLLPFGRLFSSFPPLRDFRGHSPPSTLAMRCKVVIRRI